MIVTQAFTYMVPLVHSLHARGSEHAHPHSPTLLWCAKSTAEVVDVALALHHCLLHDIDLGG